MNIIPTILICGNKNEIEKKLINCKVLIEGQIYLSGNIEEDKFNFFQDHKIYFNEQIHPIIDLLELLKNNDIDYIIFDIDNCLYLQFAKIINENYSQYRNLLYTKINSIESFLFKYNNILMYDFAVEKELIKMIKFNDNIKSILDIHGYFVNSSNFINTLEDTKIDCISKNTVLPIFENKYDHIYKNLEQAGLKHYDAILLTKDIETPDDLLVKCIILEDYSDFIILFAKKNSELEENLLKLQKFNDFTIISSNSTYIGTWFILDKNINYNNLMIYSISYNKIPDKSKLPDNYTILKCGDYQLNNTTGLVKDNTGDNISHLNLYLNEITGLYWAWKNTKYSIIGFCHYRRFFTESDNEDFSYDKIITKENIIKYFKSYDMILCKIATNVSIQKEVFEETCFDKKIINLIISKIKRYLLKFHPEYLSIFEKILNSYQIYYSHLFITRDYIFDSYCEWLFSFTIDIVNEILASSELRDENFNNRRVLAYVFERMLNVWLMNQNLRIKELNIMLNENI